MQTHDLPVIKKNVYLDMLAPDTVSDFQCIMGGCEDNCCRNTTWSISVDAEAYKKYETLNNDVGQRILDCIESRDAKLVFKEFGDGKCPLMLESGLCYIHKELGAEYLCQTCATYPRFYGFFNDKLEHWLSLSCPEVVRHVLYQKKGTNYIERPYTIAKKQSMRPQDPEKALVRDMLAKIASFRKLKLKEKLLYMGLFMRSISKISVYSPNYTSTIRKTIRNYTDNLKGARKTLSEVTGKLGNADQVFRTGTLMALSAFAYQVALPPKIHPVDIENVKFYTLMANFHKDHLNGASKEYIQRTFDEKIVPYVNARPHVFENYLMYSLISSRFLADSSDFATCFAGFAGEFATMLVFACMFHEYDSIGDEEMVAAIYLFHRRISHSQTLRKLLAAQFSDNILVFLLTVLNGID